MNLRRTSSTARRLVSTALSVAAFGALAAGCAVAPHDGDSDTISSTGAALAIAGWKPDSEIPDRFLLAQESYLPPAMAAINGTAYLVHSNGASKNTTTGQLNANYDLYWTKKIGGDWRLPDRIGNQSSYFPPTLAAFNGYLYMLHTSGSGDVRQVWYARFDPRTETWTGDSQIYGYRSEGTPGIVASGGRLLIVGVNPSDKKLWQATMDTSERFSTPQPLAYMYSSSPPSLTDFGGRIYMVHMAGTTNAMVYNSWNGTSWGADVTVTNDVGGSAQTSSVPPVIAAYGSYIHMVYRDAGSDQILWTYFDGARWSRRVTLPNMYMHGQAALAAAYDRLVLVHQPSDSDFYNPGWNEQPLWWSSWYDTTTTSGGSTGGGGGTIGGGGTVGGGTKQN